MSLTPFASKTFVILLVCAATSALLGAPAFAKPKAAKPAKAKVANSKPVPATTKPAPAPAQPPSTKGEAPAAKPASEQAKPASEPAKPVGGDAQQVADGIQQFYDKQPGFRAAFTQVVTKKGLATGLKREGVAWLRKGDTAQGDAGKMRFDYPSEEIFYFCNGETLWSYERRERLAVQVPVKNSQVFQATQYLVGQGNLSRDFKLELVTSPLPDTYALKLVPKGGTQLMKSLTLVVDRATFAVKASKLVDPLGDSTDLVWRDVKYERADDKTFEWTPPPGVTVKDLGKSVK